MTTVLPLFTERPAAPTVTQAPSARTAEASVNHDLLNGHRYDLDGNRRAPRTFEFPWHKQAAYLAATGMSMRAIAEMCDVTEGKVQQLFRAPGFQEMVSDLLHEHAGKDIMEAFKGEALGSFATLVQLRDDASAPAAVRLKAAAEILDRGYGKAVQRVEAAVATTSLDPVAEAKHLQSQLDAIQGEAVRRALPTGEAAAQP